MISWFNYKGMSSDTKLISKLVGVNQDRYNATRQYTNQFLVVARFKRIGSTIEIRKAIMYLEDGSIQVDGMSGNVEILNWSVMNLPKGITDGN